MVLHPILASLYLPKVSPTCYNYFSLTTDEPVPSFPPPLAPPLALPLSFSLSPRPLLPPLSQGWAAWTCSRWVFRRRKSSSPTTASSRERLRCETGASTWRSPSSEWLPFCRVSTSALCKVCVCVCTCVGVCVYTCVSVCVCVCGT